MQHKGFTRFFTGVEHKPVHDDSHAATVPELDWLGWDAWVMPVVDETMAGVS